MTVAIKNCELRDESWEKLAISVFPGGICYDYATARAKVRKAEETSDLQSDAEVTKRKIIPKRYSSSVESGPDHTPRMSQTPRMIQDSMSLLPPPPKIRKPVTRSEEIVFPSTSYGSQEGNFPDNIEIDAGPSGSSSSNNSYATDGDLKTLLSKSDNRTKSITTDNALGNHGAGESP